MRRQDGDNLQGVLEYVDISVFFGLIVSCNAFRQLVNLEE